jgi:hypothetical protein
VVSTLWLCAFSRDIKSAKREEYSGKISNARIKISRHSGKPPTYLVF